MAVSIGVLENALLLPGSQPVHDDNKSEVWKGPIKTHAVQTLAFVKLPTPNQLVSEAVCALLGRALGLNIPKPYLVLITKAALPKSGVWAGIAATSRLGFGLEDGTHPSMRRWFNNQWQSDPARVLAVLSQWPGCQDVAIFDEWIANTDRHLGNVLFDGTQDFVLIDHGHALTGPKWKAATLRDPAVSVTNRLLHERTKSLSPFEKYQWRKAANDEAHRYRNLETDALISAAAMSRYVSQVDADAACTFLRARVNEMVPLICKKLGIGVIV